MNLIAVDIGNTHIVIGYFQGKKLVQTWRLVSEVSRTVDEYSLVLKGLLEESSVEASKLDKVIICCVVPPLARVFSKLFQKYFSLTPVHVESEQVSQIEIDCDMPSTVGADRVVNALAARELYGAPGIVVDFGTATTFDVISIEGNYQGGVIAPGLLAASEALTSKAAMLPSIEISEPGSVIGKNTHDSMLSGIVYGYAGLVDGILVRISNELGVVPSVTATGGLARLMSQYTDKIDNLAPDLTLEGLRMLAAE